MSHDFLAGLKNPTPSGIEYELVAKNLSSLLFSISFIEIEPSTTLTTATTPRYAS